MSLRLPGGQGRPQNCGGKEVQPMEFLDVVDENGVPTGAQVERARAHAEGVRHRTAHVWLVRHKAGRLQVLLQKRSAEKDSFPGCYDISSAGHIPAGVEYLPSALRELREELGVMAAAQQLVYCGQRSFFYEGAFHGRPFCDRQVSNIYLLWLDREPRQFTLQAEEVSEVRWFDFDACVQSVEQNTIPHCIYAEELYMVRRAAEQRPAAKGETV